MFCATNLHFRWWLMTGCILLVGNLWEIHRPAQSPLAPRHLVSTQKSAWSPPGLQRPLGPVWGSPTSFTTDFSWSPTLNFQVSRLSRNRGLGYFTMPKRRQSSTWPTVDRPTCGRSTVGLQGREPQKPCLVLGHVLRELEPPSTVHYD